MKFATRPPRTCGEAARQAIQCPAMARRGSYLLISSLAGAMVSAVAHAAPAPATATSTLMGGARGDAVEAPGEGWTIVDLGDAWAPYPLDGAARAGGDVLPRYRQTFIDLASGRFGGDAMAAEDRALELFGVAPSLHLVLAAMDDEARHRCHDAIAPGPLLAVKTPMRREPRERAQERRRALERTRGRVDAALRRHGVSSVAELRDLNPSYARLVTTLERAEAVDAAIRALQAHLVCDGLMVAGAPRGAFDVTTMRALAAFQRRNWIVGAGELDGDTVDALGLGSRELDLRLALRVLRVRVADAAGLIEDGSARGEWGTVLGRQLDPAELRFQGPYPALKNGAADRISPATEAAARALGWSDFASTRAGLRALLSGTTRQVAVRLPSPPAYDRTPLELRAVIDRGDVVDADPRTRRGQRLARAATHRPVLVVFAGEGADEVALVRWPTTVGGWKDEKLSSRRVVRRYKGSDLGARAWRDLVVAPAWYPPSSTPDDELLGVRDGKWVLKEDLLGPGYRSAYGLVMLIHHERVDHGDHSHMLDHGIRTHGSVSYRSILTGSSHGCHRLYNHHALRLATFLLKHRRYAVRGPVDEVFARTVRRPGQRWRIYRRDRGFYFELLPPVAVEVGAGMTSRACES
jgi:hypothetical protein